MKMKKFGKMLSIFEFSISKLGYVIKTFFTNQGKNEDQDKKIGKMSSIFQLSMLILHYMELLIKI